MSHICCYQENWDDNNVLTHMHVPTIGGKGPSDALHIFPIFLQSCPPTRPIVRPCPEILSLTLRRVLCGALHTLNLTKHALQ